MPEPGSPDVESQTTVEEPLVERRRPGRIEYSNPHVIALMRAPTTIDSGAVEISTSFDHADTEAEDSDNLAPAKGILTGLLLALPLWALIGAGAWFLLSG